jgi:hypothetical protein
MIKQFQKQTGSAYIVIIIVFVVAIIGLLGFVFWQQVSKTKVSTDQTNTTTSTDKYANWGTYQSDRDGYSTKYPQGWILIKETDSDGPYIRNFDPTPKTTHGGYPEGYINVRVLLTPDDAGFKAVSGLTTTQWYEALGVSDIQDGAVTYKAADVKQMTVNGIPAKSAKSVFTETDEEIYFLKGNILYSINVYPYGASSDPTVKLMLDSFKFL